MRILCASRAFILVDEIPEVLVDTVELDRPSDSDSASLFRRSRSCSFFSLRSLSIAIAALLARDMTGADIDEYVEWAEGVAAPA